MQNLHMRCDWWWRRIYMTEMDAITFIQPHEKRPKFLSIHLSSFVSSLPSFFPFLSLFFFYFFLIFFFPCFVFLSIRTRRSKSTAQLRREAKVQHSQIIFLPVLEAQFLNETPRHKGHRWVKWWFEISRGSSSLVLYKRIKYSNN